MLWQRLQLNVKARCHYQSFPSKTLSKKTWTKCLLSLSKFLDHLCQRIGGKSCKHKKNGSNSHKNEIMKTLLSFMSNEHCNPQNMTPGPCKGKKQGNQILFAEKETKEAHTIHLLKNCTLKTRTSSEIIQSILL